MPGICVLGDRARTNNPHRCSACPDCGKGPHMAAGPSTIASANVLSGGKPVLRVGDTGIHNDPSCCGSNTWKVVVGSSGVVINGTALVRQNDKTMHCGSAPGKMIDGSGSVLDNSP